MIDQQEYLQKTIEHCRILARLKRKNQILGISNTNVNKKKKSDFVFLADPNISSTQIWNQQQNVNPKNEQRNLNTTKKNQNIPPVIHCRILKFGLIGDCFDAYRTEYLEMMREFWKLHDQPTKTLSNQSTLIKLSEKKPIIETQIEQQNDEQQKNDSRDKILYSRNIIFQRKFKTLRNLQQILDQSETVEDICIFYL